MYFVGDGLFSSTKRRVALSATFRNSIRLVPAAVNSSAMAAANRNPASRIPLPLHRNHHIWRFDLEVRVHTPRAARIHGLNEVHEIPFRIDERRRNAAGVEPRFRIERHLGGLVILELRKMPVAQADPLDSEGSSDGG